MNKTDYLRQGKFLGDKVKYKDGVGVCFWIPLDEKEPEIGMCFDLEESDMDDLIALLQGLKAIPARKFVEKKIKKKRTGSSDGRAQR